MQPNRREPVIVGSRPSFLAKKISTWRGNLAVLLLLIGCLQFAIYLIHLVWLLEAAAWTWATRG